MKSCADNSSSSSLVWLTRLSAAWRRVCSRVSSARSSAEDAAGSAAGVDGWEVERRFEAGSRAEKRDWNPGRRPADVGGIPLVDDGRDGGGGSAGVEEVLSWRSSSS